jgi:predicted GNAT family acetyltransferase
VHTEVPSALQRRGIASALAEAALAHAREHGYKVDPRCAFMRGYMQRHPETRPLHV